MVVTVMVNQDLLSDDGTPKNGFNLEQALSRFPSVTVDEILSDVAISVKGDKRAIEALKRDLGDICAVLAAPSYGPFGR